MMSDEELPEDEEEILVYVEFDTLISDNAFANEQLRLDMIGIDTEHPIMQINGRFYEGTYEDVVGTFMLFEKQKECETVDPVFDIASNLKYINKTRKVLKMQRVFIENRAEVLGDSEHSQCIPNLDIIKEAGVPVKYQENALSFWNKLRDYRMDVLNLYLEKQQHREEMKSQGLSLDSESDEEHPFAAYRTKEGSLIPKEKGKKSNKLKSLTKRTERIMDSIMEEKPSTSASCNTRSNAELTCTNAEPSLSSNTDPDNFNVKKENKKKQHTMKTQSGHTVPKRKVKKSQTSKTDDNLSVEEKEEQDEEASNKQCIDVAADDQNDEIYDALESDNIQDKSHIADRKNQKELKREAKMQEILNRLNALAEN